MQGTGRQGIWRRAGVSLICIHAPQYMVLMRSAVTCMLAWQESEDDGSIRPKTHGRGPGRHTTLPNQAKICPVDKVQCWADNVSLQEAQQRRQLGSFRWQGSQACQIQQTGKLPAKLLWGFRLVLLLVSPRVPATQKGLALCSLQLPGLLQGWLKFAVLMVGSAAGKLGLQGRRAAH